MACGLGVILLFAGWFVGDKESAAIGAGLIVTSSLGID